tara:strand:+ start:399 stop:521 length:123 start_codon:yes stop_codon:yes gene_type:complete
MESIEGTRKEIKEAKKDINILLILVNFSIVKLLQEENQGL